MKLVLRKLFGEQVRKHREAVGLTQEKLAEKIGIHRTYIGSIERAEQSVSLDNAERIAQALKVPLRQLIEK